jgi:hypothetical protein
MDLDVIFGLALFLLYFVIVPALTFLRQEERHRDRWRRRWLVEVPEPTPGGPFRDDDGQAPSPRRYVAEHHGAPRGVKVVAVVSLVLGHMFLPGLLAGLFGLPFYGLGLVSIPGLVLAARIYGNAFGLLRCAPWAAAEARRLQTFAVRLNVVVLSVVAVCMLAWGLHPLLVFTAVYACISLLHAEGLGRAADAIDAVHSGTLEVVTRDELPLEIHLAA